MARRCTTVPGFGACCRAATQGILNQPFRMMTSHGERCAVCTTHQSTSRDPRKSGRTVFQFRFARNATCGIGPGGCPALAQGGGGGPLTLPGSPSGGGFTLNP